MPTFTNEYEGRLDQIIIAKYPNEFEQGLFGLQDNGNGIEFSYWNVPNVVVPDISSFTEDQTTIDFYKFKKNKESNQAIYDLLNDIDIKTIRALRENDTSRINALEEQATSLRAQLLPVS